MIARALLAIAAAAAAFALATTGRAERFFGAEPTLRFDVDIPVAALDTHPASAIEASWRARLRDRDIEIAPGPHRPGQLTATIEVVAPAAQAPAIARALTLPGAMSMRWVAEDTPTARAWFRAFDRAGGDPTAGIVAFPDAWFHEPTGREYEDFYLAGPDRGSLFAAVDALVAADPAAAIPAELELVLEEILPHPDGEGPRRPYFRTYLLERATILTQLDVAASSVTYDPNTQRPEVGVTFTRDGGDRFGDATFARQGDKLAIVVDGNVTSAPIVQRGIRGGRISITMGGDEPRAMELEAAALAAALTGGQAAALPPGIEARLAGADDAASGRWLTRILLGLAAGLLAWLAATVLARKTVVTAVPLVAGPALVRPPPAWGRAALAAAVTLGLPALVVVVGRSLRLPGFTEELDDVLRIGDGGDPGRVGVFALGILPLLSAFWLAELVAFAVPSWRRARLGTPADRRAIDRVALALTFALATLQAVLVQRWFADLAARGFPLTTGTLSAITIVATLVAGVFALAVIADLITRHGLANGVLVLAATGMAIPLVDDLRHPHPGAPYPLVAAIAAGLAVVTIALARLRPRGSGRLPWTGIVPLALPGLLVGFATVSTGLWDAPARWLEPYWRQQLWIDTLAAIPIAAAILWHRGDRRPLPLALTLGYLALLAAAPAAVDAPFRVPIQVLGAPVVAVALLELAVGLAGRLRLGAAVVVHRVHDVDRADRLSDALTDAGIDHVTTGVHARAVLRMFGGFCPIELRVAAADAARATAVLAERAAALEVADATGAAGLTPARLTGRESLS